VCKSALANGSGSSQKKVKFNTKRKTHFEAPPIRAAETSYVDSHERTWCGTELFFFGGSVKGHGYRATAENEGEAVSQNSSLRGPPCPEA